MVWMQDAADAWTLGQPEPTSLGWLLRDFQPLATPDALNPILANLKSAIVRQGANG
jgi:hypothetical protein